MKGLRAMALLAALTGACTVVDKTKVALETIGLGERIPCDTDRADARRLAGAYLRTISGTPGGETFTVSGRTRDPSTAPLPRNIAIADSVLRRISVGDDGTLTGWRQSSATPIAALNDDRTTLPLAYTLSFSSDGTDFTGPLVAGLPPLQETVPTLGQAVYTGAIIVTQTSVDADGTTTVTEATGSFTMQIGYGSGRADFSARDFTVTRGPALPFANMRWTRLGTCGARLISSGQGVVSLYDASARRVPTLGPGADPTAGILLFEASQFAPTANSGPFAVGGVLAIQGDTSSLTAAFLSRPPP